MKQKFLLTAMLAAIVTLSGCVADNTPTADAKTAMQKKYNTQADCAKDFPVAGDCTFVTQQAMAGTGATHAGGGYFMSPFFYPWGGIIHNNGTTTYNSRVPTSGYVAAAPTARLAAASKSVNFSRVPSSYGARFGGSTRGGFGGSARGGYSSGG